MSLKVTRTATEDVVVKVDGDQIYLNDQPLTPQEARFICMDLFRAQKEVSDAQVTEY